MRRFVGGLSLLIVLATSSWAAPVPDVVKQHMARMNAISKAMFCNANLATISIGARMYRDGHAGKSPAGLKTLIPEYLATAPKCSSSGKSNYKMRLKGGQLLVFCAGHYHADAGLPADYPRLDGGKNFLKPGVLRGKITGQGMGAVTVCHQGEVLVAKGQIPQAIAKYREALAKGLDRGEPLKAQELQRFIKEVGGK